MKLIGTLAVLVGLSLVWCDSAEAATKPVAAMRGVRSAAHLRASMVERPQASSAVTLATVTVVGRRPVKVASVWRCGEPRALVQGSGTVKVCEVSK